MAEHAWSSTFEPAEPVFDLSGQAESIPFDLEVPVRVVNGSAPGTCFHAGVAAKSVSLVNLMSGGRLQVRAQKATVRIAGGLLAPLSIQSGETYEMGSNRFGIAL